MNGLEHEALEPHPYGVPWPTWDGQGGDPVMDAMEQAGGLIGYLCQHYYDNQLPGGVCDNQQLQ